MLHTIGLAVIIIALCIMAPKQSSAYIFAGFSNSSEWENNGASWVVRLASRVYPFQGQYSLLHPALKLYLLVQRHELISSFFSAMIVHVI